MWLSPSVVALERRDPNPVLAELGKHRLMRGNGRVVVVVNITRDKRAKNKEFVRRRVVNWLRRGR